MKVAIVGTGAMGSVYAALLADAGNEVWAIDQWQDHVDAINRHGLRLEGGLGPALRSEQLAERPLELLVATILDGRFGTAMPPWRPFLSEEEARWLAVGLKSGNLP